MLNFLMDMFIILCACYFNNYWLLWLLCMTGDYK